MKIRRRHAVILTIACVAIDQIVKNWVESSLPFHEPVPVLPFLSWYRTWNEGIAFSFLTFLDDRLLAILTMAIVLFVFWLWRRTPRHRWLSQIGFALITGGAIGNLLDRAFLGHVVDFILFHVGNWSFAVFNLADSFISVGAAAIVLEEILMMTRDGGTDTEKDRKKKKA